MQVLSTPSQLQDAITTLKTNGKTIAFVPTMGALHIGHLTLVEHAKTQADEVVVSIFVNPTQFGEGEDLDVYPRTEQQDCTLLQQAGVSIVYLPKVQDIYPDGPKRADVQLKNADILEGAFRPGFFYGVATVVNILFDQVKPDIAIFGEKDFQQLCMIRQIAQQRDDDIEISGVPIVRENDGLAFSSRNRYLNDQERKVAPHLYSALQQIAEEIHTGSEVLESIERAKTTLLAKGFTRVDYIELVDALSCGGVEKEKPTQLVAAAWLGKTRLIDTCAV